MPEEVCYRLKDTGALGGKPSGLPLDQNTKLSKDQGEAIPNPKAYRKLIGRLMYLTLTMPDLAYSIQVPS